ncbi:hypothetical protein AV530_003541 [Patagioenas fasciata monilis]|uniref:Uncharacterized protein n=1 Tax=Patagioenas fasciata monilis TaxID=372326 RepID=A0A1V4K338_PATFA|nr:hypothetical protein AV530_003541 [Patagioenas fasciata monilis]
MYLGDTWKTGKPQAWSCHQKRHYKSSMQNAKCPSDQPCSSIRRSVQPEREGTEEMEPGAWNMWEPGFGIPWCGTAAGNGDSGASATCFENTDRGRISTDNTCDVM